MTIRKLVLIAIAALAAFVAAPPQARIKIDTDRVIGEVDPHVFGNFAEHLGRCIYGGIYEEGSPLSDADGYRKDVMEAARGLGVTLLRWPGGNFVSGYNWKDGIGPRDQRPVRPRRRLGRARDQPLRHRRVPALLRAARRRALHLHQRRARHGGGRARTGSSTATKRASTYWAEQRRKNGRDKPYNVKYWGLGNEIDGPWQLGHKNAEDYAKFALEAAKAMRRVDASIKLIACGSCNFGPGADWIGWNRTVLERLHDEIDYISLHTYIGNRENNFERFLAASRRHRRPHRSRRRARSRPRASAGRTPAPSTSPTTSGTSGIAPAAARGVRNRPAPASRRSTTSRTRSPWACSSTPSSATPTSSRWRTWRSSSTSSRPIFTNEQGLFLQPIYFPHRRVREAARQPGARRLDRGPAYSTGGRPPLGYLDVSPPTTEGAARVYLNVLNRSETDIAAASRTRQAAWARPRSGS